VLAVVVFHARGGQHPEVLPGGFLGVSLFFTLSGYLICSLLIGEQERTGSIRWTAFWARRFRRLSPAAFVVIGACVAIPVVWDGAWGRYLASADVIAALGSWSNLWQIHLVDTGRALRVLGPLGPFWSLALEEQFYLAISVIALLSARTPSSRRTLAGVLGVIGVGSIVIGLTAKAPDAGGSNVRWLFAPDVRAVELVAGCLLALSAFGASAARRPSGEPGASGVSGARDAAGAPVLDVAGWVAAGVTLLAFVTLSEGSSFVRHGLFAVAAVVNVVLISGALAGGSLARALAWRPLVELGRLSYTWYLVHWPVILVLRPGRVGIDGAALTVVQVVVGLAVAAALSVLVERPIRSGRRLPAPASVWAWLLAAGSIAGVALGLELARG